MYAPRTSTSSTLEYAVYNAYLKFSNGEKIHLKKARDKNKLAQILKPLSEAVGIDITVHD
jgi:hypothetical protein